MESLFVVVVVVVVVVANSSVTGYAIEGALRPFLRASVQVHCCFTFTCRDYKGYLARGSPGVSRP